MSEDMVATPVEEAEETIEQEDIVVSYEDYDKIVEKYLDKNGVLSYDLLNKDFIKFMKSSTIVGAMIAERESAGAIRDYVIGNRYRNITGNEDLTEGQIARITELLDEVSPKGVFKELNAEIRKSLGDAKK